MNWNMSWATIAGGWNPGISPREALGTDGERGTSSGTNPGEHGLSVSWGDYRY